MKKLFLLITIFVFATGVSVQTFKGEGSILGNLGYQTKYERSALGAQGRYVIANNLRIAPDLNLFFPKDKVTGLDVDINFHYVFNFSKDGQGFSVYPLAGIGMQNNFYGKRTITVDGESIEQKSNSTSKFAFNLGGGISLPLSAHSFLNAEAKFMFADEDNVVIMLGYGYKF
ncbi:MAG: outer membrane beta-barrel protein [Bacteroides sp.]|nr:outer membrane beta-barrel protein [Bacteroides sp.]